MIKLFVFVLTCLELLHCVRSANAAEPLFSSQNSSTPARVVIVEEPGAVKKFRPVPAKIPSMIDRGIQRLTGKPTTSMAWRSLVSTQDVIGIKVYSAPGANSGTRPAVVAAVVAGLLSTGLPAKQIILWDKQTTDLRMAGYYELADRYKIRVAGSAASGYDEKVFYESTLIGNLVWGDLEFGRKGDAVGRKSFVSKLVTREITKIINITPLLNHNVAGVTGNLLSLTLGSVDNTIRFETQAERLAIAIPEIYAMPILGDRVILNIVDALICQYQGEQRSLLHYSTALNQVWLSRDPVALDVLSIRELALQRNAARIPSLPTHTELYQNASLLELGVGNLKNIEIERIH
jgi:hypothetical protein